MRRRNWLDENAYAGVEDHQLRPGCDVAVRSGVFVTHFSVRPARETIKA